VTDDDQVQAMVATTLAECGGLDVAVNCAGHQESTPLRALTPERLRSMVEVQLVGALFVLRTAATRWRSGAAVVPLRVLAHGAEPCRGARRLRLAQEGLEYATPHRRREYGPAGPGELRGAHLIDTPMTPRISSAPAWSTPCSRETPLRRMGTPDDVARAALFLCSDDAAPSGPDAQCVDVAPRRGAARRDEVADRSVLACWPP
jgi:NAD(P)-dependent dehydrogenase (short-subunit alcohol dehydrogenase family)